MSNEEGAMTRYAWLEVFASGTTTAHPIVRPGDILAFMTRWKKAAKANEDWEFAAELRGIERRLEQALREHERKDVGTEASRG